MIQHASAIILALTACAADSGPGDNRPAIHVNDLCVHDPFILLDSKTRRYITYRGYSPNRPWDRALGIAQHAGVVAYTSKDLVWWDGPRLVFEIPEGFWADRDSAPWAPEVHEYKGKYYLFTTFNAWHQVVEVRADRPPITRRASQILVGDSPLGPFKPFANKPHTPAGELTLDATFHVEDGQPWLVYCHEWVQISDGLIKTIRLKPDLSEAEGKPITLLNAAEVPWTAKTVKIGTQVWPGRITDGPELYRMKNGTLAMLWSSMSTHHRYAQAVAYSPSGKLAGPWTRAEEPLLQDDRGHGMIFQTFDGSPRLVVHRYFSMPKTRVQIWSLHDEGNRLSLGSQLLGSE